MSCGGGGEELNYIRKAMVSGAAVRKGKEKEEDSPLEEKKNPPSVTPDVQAIHKSVIDYFPGPEILLNLFF